MEDKAIRVLGNVKLSDIPPWEHGSEPPAMR
jgi:hypothetical protein